MIIIKPWLEVCKVCTWHSPVTALVSDNRMLSAPVFPRAAQTGLGQIWFLHTKLLGKTLLKSSHLDLIITMPHWRQDPPRTPNKEQELLYTCGCIRGHLHETDTCGRLPTTVQHVFVLTTSEGTKALPELWWRARKGLLIGTFHIKLLWCPHRQQT